MKKQLISIISLTILFLFSCKTTSNKTKSNDSLISKHKVTIYQDGKEFEVKGDTIPINLKNKKFSIRFYVEKGKPSMIAFFADKDIFQQIGNEKKGEIHCFAYGTSGGLLPEEIGKIPKTYTLNKAWSYTSHHDLFEDLLVKLPSKNKKLLRKELVITSLEGETMKNLYLHNIYAILYHKFGDSIIDKKLMTKISLRFPKFKKKKTYIEDRIDLENLNFETFDAKEFYKEAIAQKRVYRDTLIAARGGIQYHQGNLDLLDEYEDRSFRFIYRKPLTFGKVLKYKKLSFSNLEVLTDNNGEVIGLSTYPEAFNIDELLPFIKELNAIFGKAKNIKGNLQWRDGEKIIQLVKERMKYFDKKRLTQLIITRQKTSKKLQKFNSSIPFINFKYDSDLDVLNNVESLVKGKILYQNRCAACHRENAGGLIGPNLTDNRWILGGGYHNIYNVIAKGVNENQSQSGIRMFPFEKLLSNEKIKLITNYIISLQGTNPKNAKKPEGDIIWPKK